MYVRKQPWCVYLVLNEQDDLRTFRKIISLYLCKSRFFENCTPSQKKIHKNLSPHFSWDFRRHTMRYKINPFTFYAEKSSCLQPQNKKHPHFLCRFINASMREKIYLLTFSADLQALCTSATKDFLIPPHFYKGIQNHFEQKIFRFYKQITCKHKAFTFTKEKTGSFTT